MTGRASAQAGAAVAAGAAVWCLAALAATATTAATAAQLGLVKAPSTGADPHIVFHINVPWIKESSSLVVSSTAPGMDYTTNDSP